MDQLLDFSHSKCFQFDQVQLHNIHFQVGNIYCGRSLVVDPYGKILLDMKKKHGIGFVNIDLNKVKQTRKVLPLLKNRRTDVYPTLKA